MCSGGQEIRRGVSPLASPMWRRAAGLPRSDVNMLMAHGQDCDHNCVATAWHRAKVIAGWCLREHAQASVEDFHLQRKTC